MRPRIASHFNFNHNGVTSVFPFASRPVESTLADTGLRMLHQLPARTADKGSWRGARLHRFEILGNPLVYSPKSRTYDAGGGVEAASTGFVHSLSSFNSSWSLADLQPWCPHLLNGPTFAVPKSLFRSSIPAAEPHEPARRQRLPPYALHSTSTTPRGTILVVVINPLLEEDLARRTNHRTHNAFNPPQS